MANVDKDNILLDRSFAFAVRVVKLRKFLLYEVPFKEHDISKQLVRSASSVGANVEEAQGAQSDSDFLSKMSIAYKEARESRYWVRLLSATDYLSPEAANSLLSDIDELCRILSKIIIKTKLRIKNKNQQ